MRTIATPGPYVIDASFPARKRIYERYLEQSSQDDGIALNTTRFCKLTGISRATFYRHFGSLDGFLSRLLDDTLASVMTEWPTHLSIFQAIALQCRELQENALLQKVLSTRSFEPRLSRIATSRMRDHLMALSAGGENASLDRELLFQIDAASICLPPMLLQWAHEGKGGSATAFAANAVSTCPERLMSIVGNSYY